MSRSQSASPSFNAFILNAHREVGQCYYLQFKDGELQHRGAKWLAQGHTETLWQNPVKDIVLYKSKNSKWVWGNFSAKKILNDGGLKKIKILTPSYRPRFSKVLKLMPNWQKPSSGKGWWGQKEYFGELGGKMASQGGGLFCFINLLLAKVNWSPFAANKISTMDFNRNSYTNVERFWKSHP